ncbi:MAG: F0F1 ATP synthase subunit gamma [Rhodospirillaceae bacterium]|nr:F0F1 ATP synthase subunit gamma [Rhodospirillaceae bacterium]
MEERLPELHARLESLTELQEIVGALRSIAIMRMQQAFGALPGIRHYAQAIDEALAQAIPLLGKSDPWSSPTAGKGRTGVFAFTSEHGLVGAYNERILERASAAAGHDGALMMVGARGETLAEEQGRPPIWFHRMATHESGVIEVARAAAAELYRCVGQGEITTVHVIYGESVGSSGWEVRARTLVPFDATPYRAREGTPHKPLLHLPPPLLMDRLIDEFIFSELMHAAMAAFASINSARFQCMESAHGNIDKKVALLSQKMFHQRQEEVTAELLDIVTGVEAMNT